jgi:hypothetical protein
MSSFKSRKRYIRTTTIPHPTWIWWIITTLTQVQTYCKWFWNSDIFYMFVAIMSQISWLTVDCDFFLSGFNHFPLSCRATKCDRSTSLWFIGTPYGEMSLILEGDEETGKISFCHNVSSSVESSIEAAPRTCVSVCTVQVKSHGLPKATQ